MRAHPLCAIPLVLLGCTDAMDASDPLAPQYGQAGASGCYIVEFTATLSPSSAMEYSGPLTGDLQGTAVNSFQYANAPTGVTNASGGVVTWTITGGIVPELIGASFVTEFDNRNVFFFDDGFAMNLGRHRAAGGVDKANLTHNGRVALSTGIVVLDLHGVICPS